MSSHENTTETTPEEEYKTYGQIIWGQFKQYRLSYLCLWGVLGLFVLAMVSPIIALNVPFYMSVPEGAAAERLTGVSFPWFVALFDQNFFNSGVDIFFNFLLFYVPFAALTWFGIARKMGTVTCGGDGGRRRFWIGAGTLIGGITLLVLFLHGGAFVETLADGELGDRVRAIGYAVGYIVFAGVVVWLVDKLESAGKDPHRQRRLVFALLAGVLAAFGFILVYTYGFRQPFVDYVRLADIEGVSAFFPFIEYSYRDVNLMAVSEGPSAEHWLGTDREGRDVFTRILYGTRISLTIGVVAVGIYATIGMILGSLAGFFGGTVDTIILRMIEIMICFPVIFLLLTIAGFIEEPSVFHIMLIIGLTGWTRIARLVRGEFLRLRNQDFVQAATALGLDRVRIIFGHVMPNAVQPVYVAATFGIAGAILIEATLAFLGVGPPDVPSWGQILTAGRNTQDMTMILASGFAIFIVISLLNLIGEGLRDATDPKLRK